MVIIFKLLLLSKNKSFFVLEKYYYTGKYALLLLNSKYIYIFTN